MGRLTEYFGSSSSVGKGFVEMQLNDTLVIKHKGILEMALSTNPETRELLQKMISKAIAEARNEVVRGIRLKNDPRKAVHGVRRTVYEKILGANINIYNSKKTGKPTTYEPPRTLRKGQRGGNRVPRGKRTQRVMTYGPHERQWILRIINSGTVNGPRQAGTRGGRLSGNRGEIAARNFFGRLGNVAITKAVDNLANMVDEELEKIMEG